MAIPDLQIVLPGDEPRIIEHAKRIINFAIWYYMGKVEESFLIRSNGGTDELGNKWKPLSPITIAKRRVTPEDYRKYDLAPKGGRGLLTAKQDEIWRGIYARRLAELGNDPARKADAAKRAWAILKSRYGARVKWRVLASRKVQILIDTGRLYNSMRQGEMLDGQYVPPAEQLFRITISGRSMIVELDTLVPYADEVDRDRPLFPPGSEKWLSLIADMLGSFYA